MKKIFISQPIGGKTESQIFFERRKAFHKIERILGEPITLINSIIRKFSPTDSSLWYLGRSIQKMAVADIVFFVKGWENARGCRIEHLCAEEYGYRIIEE